MTTVCADCAKCLYTTSYPMCKATATHDPVFGTTEYRRCRKVNEGRCPNFSPGQPSSTLARHLLTVFGLTMAAALAAFLYFLFLSI